MFGALVLVFVLAPNAGLDSSTRTAVVTKADLGAAWPLNVDGALLHCRVRFGLPEVTVEVAGSNFGLNEAAVRSGSPPPLVLAIEGRSLDPLLQRGLALCSPPPTPR